MSLSNPWTRLVVTFAVCLGIAALTSTLPRAQASDFFCNGWFATISGQVTPLTIHAPDPNGDPTAFSRVIFNIRLADPLPAAGQAYSLDYQTVPETGPGAAISGQDYLPVSGTETYQNTNVKIRFSGI
jgi:hypothetical protein